MNDCLFCKICQGEIPAQRIYESKTLVAFLDINPVNPGHTLLVPKAHYPDFLTTPVEVLSDLVQTTKKIMPAILQAVGASAWNLMVNSEREAGQVIFHIHWHLIPRLPNDGFRHWEGQAILVSQLHEVRERIKQFISP